MNATICNCFIVLVCYCLCLNFICGNYWVSSWPGFTWKRDFYDVLKFWPLYWITDVLYILTVYQFCSRRKDTLVEMDVASDVQTLTAKQFSSFHHQTFLTMTPVFGSNDIFPMSFSRFPASSLLKPSYRPLLVTFS